MSKSYLAYLGSAVLIVVLAGCNLLPGILPQKPPSEEMLPELPGYKTIEGQLLTDYISTLSEGAALLAGHPELAATAAGVDKIISCYQEIGAIQARVYSQEEMALSAGVVAIADRDAIMDPLNFFRCISPQADENQSFSTNSLRIKPCANTYTLEKDDNEFYILYAGTTAEICDAFCANLEGCTAP